MGRNDDWAATVLTDLRRARRGLGLLAACQTVALMITVTSLIWYLQRI